MEFHSRHRDKLFVSVHGVASAFRSGPFYATSAMLANLSRYYVHVDDRSEELLHVRFEHMGLVLGHQFGLWAGQLRVRWLWSGGWFVSCGQFFR